MNYYGRLDVRRAIMDFARADGGNGERECAFCNASVKCLQRNLGEYPVALDSAAAFDRALASGATAFYCSYWYYPGRDFSRPLGHDLVWTVRTKRGGLRSAKMVTARVIEALADTGIPNPWVKYSGQLGFDLLIPLEAIPNEIWMGDNDMLADLQRVLTNSIVNYLVERSGFSVKLVNDKNGASNVPADWHQMQLVVDGAVLQAKPSVEAQRFLIESLNGNLGWTDTCLLSELRVRRGLLLAPMSLNPESGLVSVPVSPREVAEFSVLDASPADAQAFEWTPPSQVARELKYVCSWRLVQTELAIV